MERITSIRKMNGVEHAVPCMSYPYAYIDDYSVSYYALADILRPILVESEQADAGDFPKNIQEHFWVRGGENDGDSWLSCGQLSNGNYFFYTGGCDYTGFDCQGGMSLWVSSSWENIVKHAMNQSDYQLYLEQTQELDEKEEEKKEEEEEEEEDEVRVGGRTTITLGKLIAELLALKEQLGHNAPVWHVEFGGLTATRGVEQHKRGVVIE